MRVSAIASIISSARAVAEEMAGEERRGEGSTPQLQTYNRRPATPKISRISGPVPPSRITEVPIDRVGSSSPTSSRPPSSLSMASDASDLVPQRRSSNSNSYRGSFSISSDSIGPLGMDRPRKDSLNEKAAPIRPPSAAYRAIPSADAVSMCCEKLNLSFRALASQSGALLSSLLDGTTAGCTVGAPPGAGGPVAGGPGGGEGKGGVVGGSRGGDDGAVLSGSPHITSVVPGTFAGDAAGNVDAVKAAVAAMYEQAQDFLSAVSVAHRTLTCVVPDAAAEPDRLLSCLIPDAAAAALAAPLRDTLREALLCHKAVTADVLTCIQEVARHQEAENEDMLFVLGSLCSLAFSLHSHATLLRNSEAEGGRTGLACLLAASRLLIVFAQHHTHVSLIKRSGCMSSAVELLRCILSSSKETCALEHVELGGRAITRVSLPFVFTPWLATEGVLKQLLESLSYISASFVRLCETPDLCAHLTAQGAVPPTVALAAAACHLIASQRDTATDASKMGGTQSIEKLAVQLLIQLCTFHRMVVEQAAGANGLLRAGAFHVCLGALSDSRIVKYSDCVELIVRIVSKLSEKKESQALLRSAMPIVVTPIRGEHLRVPLAALVHIAATKRHYPIIVARALYVVAGIISDESAKEERALVCGPIDSTTSGIAALCTTLNKVAASLQSQSSSKPDTGIASPSDNYEACAKVLRVMANLAVEEHVGVGLARNRALASMGDILAVACSDDARVAPAIRDELLLTCLSFLTNVSFYCDTSHLDVCCNDALKALLADEAAAIDLPKLQTLCRSDMGLASGAPVILFAVVSTYVESMLQVPVLAAEQEAGRTALIAIVLECTRVLSNVLRSSAARLLLHLCLSEYEDDEGSGVSRFCTGVCSLLQAALRDLPESGDELQVPYTALGLLLNLGREKCWKHSYRLPVVPLAGYGQVKYTTVVAEIISWLQVCCESDHPAHISVLIMCCQALCNYARGWESEAVDGSFRFTDEEAVALLQTCNLILESEDTLLSDSVPAITAARELQEILRAIVDEGAIDVREDE